MMRSFVATAAALGAAAIPLASAQTFSACNPMKNANCPADTAIATTFSTDFTAGASAFSGWTATAGSLKYVADGAEFTINKRGDAPTIQTDAYLFFGYVEVKMKAASGQGIISSIVLESDDLDEVDWEFIGGNNGQVQTNYFGKGNTTTYDRMIPYNVATPQQTVHTYALNWTAQSLVWLIDGVAVRTLNYADAVGGKNFPQTPMNVRIGIWAGGDPGNSPGTISWAGGETDYSKAPFTMTVQSVKIINYSPGCQYTYGTMPGSSLSDGSYQSIKVAAGCNGKGGSFAPVPSSNSSAAGLGALYSSVSTAMDTTCSSKLVTVTVSSGGTRTSCSSSITKSPSTTSTTFTSPPSKSSQVLSTSTPMLPISSSTSLSSSSTSSTSVPPTSVSSSLSSLYSTSLSSSIPNTSLLSSGACSLSTSTVSTTTTIFTTLTITATANATPAPGTSTPTPSLTPSTPSGTPYAGSTSTPPTQLLTATGTPPIPTSSLLSNTTAPASNGTIPAFSPTTSAAPSQFTGAANKHSGMSGGALVAALVGAMIL